MRAEGPLAEGRSTLFRILRAIHDPDMRSDARRLEDIFAGAAIALLLLSATAEGPLVPGLALALLAIGVVLLARARRRILLTALVAASAAAAAVIVLRLIM